MGGRVRCRAKTHISKIEKLDFFHTESKCSEIKHTLAMETELRSSGLKFQSCHLLDICVCMLSHFSWVWLFATLQTIAARLLSPWDSLDKNTGVGLLFSRGSSQSRDQTRASYASCIGRQVLYHYHHLRSPLDIQSIQVIKFNYIYSPAEFYNLHEEKSSHRPHWKEPGILVSEQRLNPSLVSSMCMIQ